MVNSPPLDLAIYPVILIINEIYSNFTNFAVITRFFVEFLPKHTTACGDC